MKTKFIYVLFLFGGALIGGIAVNIYNETKTNYRDEYELSRATCFHEKYLKIREKKNQEFPHLINTESGSISPLSLVDLDDPRQVTEYWKNIVGQTRNSATKLSDESEAAYRAIKASLDACDILY